jgi:uroporphyrinogen III methyltransferase/synthase
MPELAMAAGLMMKLPTIRLHQLDEVTELHECRSLIGKRGPMPGGLAKPGSGAGEIVDNQLEAGVERPLAGVTVLVPRAREQAGAFSRLLRERGAEPLEVPTIAIRALESTADLDAAIGRLAGGAYDWVVLTSVNGVAALRTRAEALGLGAGAIGGARVAAVGPATEAALRDWGVPPDLVPPAATTAALGEAFPPGQGHVLLARADIASPELSGILRAKGYRTDDVAAYRTVPLQRLDETARRRLDGGEVDWIAFTAASTVQGFARAYGAPPPPRVRVAAIGPVTAAAARTAGMRVDATASEHTIPGLVAAIERVAADPTDPADPAGR